MPLRLRSSVADEVFLFRAQHHFNSGPLKRGDLKTWLPAQLDEERDQRDLWRFFLSADSEDSEESRAFESRFLDLASSGLSLTCCTGFVGKLSECCKFCRGLVWVWIWFLRVLGLLGLGHLVFPVIPEAGQDLLTGIQERGVFPAWAPRSGLGGLGLPRSQVS